MSADESVKTELSDDMFSVPNVDIDYSVETDEEALIEEQISVDAETGEVK
jgi:cellobiose phosphorylase